ncbi:unnamed protein product, partial [Scytosiphon promiscuus]
HGGSAALTDQRCYEAGEFHVLGSRRGHQRPDEMSGGIPAAAASAPAHGGSRGEARVDAVGGVQHDADSGEETGEQEEERRQQQRRSQQQSEQECPPRQQHKQP